MTPDAKDRFTMSPGSSLLCVTGERTDQLNPIVSIAYYQTTCDSFTKVITAGPAISTDSSAGMVIAAPSISRVTCVK